MQRPIWKGYITFGLVNIPIILYSAEKKANIKFHLMDSRDKSPIRYQRINENTGEEVPWSEIAKGYEYDDNQYVLVSEEELKKIAGEHSKAINIETFVDKDALDYMDFERPYYLVPDKKGEKGYVILREALKSTNKVGIAKVVIHTKEYLAAIMPHGDALVVDLLRYHQELRKPAEFELPDEGLSRYKINAKEMKIAKELINSMADKWNPDEYKDEYQATLEKWIDEKIHHQKPESHMPSISRKTGSVINFADLLKKSLEEKQGSKTRKRPTTRRTRAKTTHHHPRTGTHH